MDPIVEEIQKLRRAKSAWYRYQQERYAYKTGRSDEFPQRPAVDIYALEKQYPRADAYLTAELWSNSDHPIRAGLGHDAMERILSGEDYTEVIERMHRAWTATKEG